MPIKIRVGQEAEAETTAKLEIRKSLNGDYIIKDHADIDIVVMLESKKILAFAAKNMTDEIYETQNRLFDYLSKKGIVELDSIRSGNVYASLEGKIQEAKDNINEIDVALLSISKWLDEEKPFEVYRDKSEEEFVQDMTEPNEEDSTELGEVPARDKKGSVTPDLYPYSPQKPY